MIVVGYQSIGRSMSWQFTYPCGQIHTRCHKRKHPVATPVLNHHRLAAPLGDDLDPAALCNAGVVVRRSIGTTNRGED